MIGKIGQGLQILASFCSLENLKETRQNLIPKEREDWTGSQQPDLLLRPEALGSRGLDSTGQSAKIWGKEDPAEKSRMAQLWDGTGDLRGIKDRYPLRFR